MPKNARIDAYLESMSLQEDTDQSPNASGEYSGGLSDDSLDAVPVSCSNYWNRMDAVVVIVTVTAFLISFRNASEAMSESVNFGQNELLQQLKQRLKKTKSESPVTVASRLSDVNNMTSIAERVEPSIAVIAKTDSKLKKV
ncbi:unnamed protein product [Onchocerca flexuosa]|uniref:MotB_plug domain-containing protein n=1 Tax=Onchocerca flexuosa TaxID=387005 RepID=A0A183HSR8_9BILA|nr:unnamed protein product [Onchocerca flexuosa]